MYVRTYIVYLGTCSMNSSIFGWKCTYVPVSVFRVGLTMALAPL